jgi:hypothetical protein
MNAVAVAERKKVRLDTFDDMDLSWNVFGLRRKYIEKCLPQTTTVYAF